MLGAFLVSASAARAERSAIRSVDTMMRNELRNISHTWRSRGTMTVAIATGVAGVAVLFLAYRSISRMVDPSTEGPDSGPSMLGSSSVLG